MERAEYRNEHCAKDIDDDEIELHAMGRLQDGPLRHHLDSCEQCRERVAEHRAWIDTLKQGLKEF
jgi:hypothetical protein